MALRDANKWKKAKSWMQTVRENKNEEIMKERKCHFKCMERKSELKAWKKKRERKNKIRKILTGTRNKKKPAEQKLIWRWRYREKNENKRGCLPKQEK